ncbi:MAG: hypothetical protein KJ793_05820, partial [Candidatus Omnitrophica bacterium]|nr:hypothetical protein [Candidatus Omnitrophota bacterium]
WMSVTFKNDANFPVFAEEAKIDLEKVKNRLQNNLQKQSKLTDAYLENLLSEELYKQKNEGLRNEEEELKKLIALQEVREIDRERSKDYLNRVEEFLEGYDPNKKTIDLETKRLILNLLFKNIKIAQKKIFAFEFFAPFNFLFFEEKQKCQTKNLKRVTNFLPPKSTSRLSAGLMLRLYNVLFSFFSRI